MITNILLSDNLKLNIFTNKNTSNTDDFSSLSLVGQVLYTEYILDFVIGGLVLLLAIERKK
jgi:NADH:ubiquinone oxidoreductase subunit 6 (subunit J)